MGVLQGLITKQNASKNSRHRTCFNICPSVNGYSSLAMFIGFWRNGIYILFIYYILYRHHTPIYSGMPNDSSRTSKLRTQPTPYRRPVRCARGEKPRQQSEGAFGADCRICTNLLYTIVSIEVLRHTYVLTCSLLLQFRVRSYCRNSIFISGGLKSLYHLSNLMTETPIRSPALSYHLKSQ